MIAAIEWVPAGAAAAAPQKYEISPAEKEMLQMIKGGKVPPDQSAATTKKETKSPSVEVTKPLTNGLPADLRMDEYSSDEDDGGAIGKLLVEDDMQEDDEVDGLDQAAEEIGNGSAREEDSDDDDDNDDLDDVPDHREYMPTDVAGLEAMGLGGNELGDLDGLDFDDESEVEDVRISPDDAMVVIAKTEEDFASLEINVYGTKTGNLFVHHDIPLPAFPLCLAHGQVSSDGVAGGNFCAVGTFEPGIEIWNLDVLNALEPSCILGGEDTTIADDIMRQNMMKGSSGKQSKRFPKSGVDGATKLRPGSHTDAVMALSWNQVHRHVIASGSADHTVKLWDVSLAGGDQQDQCCAGTFRHHRDKVQAVVWHPAEATILATGSYDRTVALLDARDSAGDNTKKVKIPSDCEALAWDPFHPEYLTAACEDGTLICWDVRNFSQRKPLWSFVANQYGGISDLSYNSHVPGMLATCSIDKTVTLWDAYAQNDSPTPNVSPHSCGSKEMQVGKLFSVGFYPSSPWVLGCGGSENQLAIWDMSCETALQTRFAARLGLSIDASDLPKQDEDFEAKMASTDAAAGLGRKSRENSRQKKKKKGNGNKKRVHKRGR